MSFRMGGVAVNMVQVSAKQVELPANGPNTHITAPHLECAWKVPFFFDYFLHVIQKLFMGAFTVSFFKQRARSCQH